LLLFTPLTQRDETAHEAAACGPALERFQEYLHLLTRHQLDPRWQGKVDLSGVVQQTLFEAHRAWEQLRTWDEARQLAWLRQALAYNLTDEVRKLGASQRGAALERSLDQALKESSARLES
jgi:RNA polymerase sigma-70 factor (ECF subfamily)